MSDPNLMDKSPEAQRRRAVMLQMQMEALGFGRREQLLTSDYRENRGYVPLNKLENHRPLHNPGTREQLETRGRENQISGWNNIHETLEHDGTAAEDQADINEGFGQTHRARLLADPTVGQYTEDGNHRGGYRGRGGGVGRAKRGDRDGRGGSGPRRVANEIRIGGQPVTRRRVRKAEAEPSASRVSTQSTNIARARVASPVPAPAVTPVQASGPRARSANTAFPGVLADSAPVFMRSIHRATPAVTSAASATTEAARPSDLQTTSTSLSTPTNTETFSRHVENEPSYQSQPAAPVADLMDVEVGQEAASQPVLAPTTPAPSVLSHEWLAQNEDLLRQSLPTPLLEAIQGFANTQLSDMGDTLLPPQPRHEATPSSAGNALIENNVGLSLAQPSGVSELRDIQTTTTNSTSTPLPVPKTNKSISKRLEEERDLIIGEHNLPGGNKRVPRAAALVESFQRLTIRDEPIAMAPRTTNQTTNTTPDTTNRTPATRNPFGTRTALVTSTRDPLGPTLPAFLRQSSPSVDAGAAARRQYAGDDTAARRSTASSLSSAPPMAKPRPTRRDTGNRSSGPALPAFLQGPSNTSDTGSAAHLQYAGK